MQPIIITIISSCVASLVALLAVWYATDRSVSIGNLADHNHSYQGLSNEGLFFFKSLDLDDDGVLTPQELAPVIEKLTKTKRILDSVQPRDAYEGENIQIKASFQPLVLESLRNAKDFFLPSFLDNEVSAGLRNWTSAAAPDKWFNTLDFKPFLPPLRQAAPGLVWPLYEPTQREYKNGRYFPQLPHERVALLSEMLTLFHPRPFLETRFAPRGAVAVVRAQNQHFLDISFRLHAEFQLNEPPSWPFWFTPAQFTGNIVISRDGKHVTYFHMFVPSTRALNVDMEWLTTDNELDMEVEIGYLPQMELESISASSRQDESTSNHDHEKIVWQEEITQGAADSALEKAMYPFKQVTYHKFADVFDRALAERKLVHNIVLWGSLDDQSC